MSSAVPTLFRLSRVSCTHCGGDIASDVQGEFCCQGCEAVHALLEQEDLSRYYDLRGTSAGVSVGNAFGGNHRDHAWLEMAVADLRTARGLKRIDLDVQGLHCTGCVWLFEELFRRQPGGAEVVVNPSRGRLSITVPSDFDLEKYVNAIERFGYAFGPARKQAESTDLVWRMGVCIAIAMNAMIFGISTYVGLTEGRIFHFFQALTFSLTAVSVVVGGTVFFRSAWQAIRARVLHLDLPIALGIALAFISSTYGYLAARGGRSYFDTLDTFIALMLVGRFLQERVLAKNRARLLEDDGIDGLFARKVQGDAVKLVPVREIAANDRLLVNPGDLVPVDADLDVVDDAAFSLDWISGESTPTTFSRGEAISAGAFSCNERAITVVARTDFAASPLLDLLRSTGIRNRDQARATAFWRTLTRYYVIGVLLIAASALAAWWIVTGDFVRSASVVTAILIVTCPCAFGIATPLAYELAQGGLRRAGLFVRTQGFLDRAATVRSVVFDKTGTLTTGALRIVGDVPALTPADEKALADMVARSSHPKSVALRDALVQKAARSGRAAPAFDDRADVREVLGLGLELQAEGAVYRLGSPRFAGAGAGDLVFTKDDAVLLDLHTDEALRPDAAREIQALRDDGFEPWILSGDGSARVQKLAQAVGVTADHAVGDQSPEGKRSWVGAHPTALFVGDGINDGLVSEAAYASGTPAIDRPFMAARCDFYFTTPGLHPVRLALRVARHLRSTTTQTLWIAMAYNVLTVSLAMAGLMSPVVCAIVMPVSSLTTVLYVTRAFSRKHPVWTS